MQATKEQPLILTLRLDPESQAFFDNERERNFPPKRNLLKAHLTLFHQLPNNPLTKGVIKSVQQTKFKIEVTGLFNLGGGVAYRLGSSTLTALHKNLSLIFADVLIPQDKQPFRPHITIQNKVTPQQARALLADKTTAFWPFQIEAIGLDLWTYLGGPWKHEEFYRFID